MLKNLPFRLRQTLLSENLTNFRYDAQFAARSYSALIGGTLAKLKGKVIENTKQTLLIDSKVDWLIQPGAALELRFNETPNPDTFAYNPIFPTAASVGLPSHWKFLHPPVRHSTRLRLQTGSRLVLEQNTLISSGSYISIWPEQKVEIGMGTIIGYECYLNTKAGLKIGQNSMIGQGVRIMDYDGHPIFYQGKTEAEDRYGGASSPIIIGDNVWIGFGAVIMKGVTIESGAMIATNSWVTQNVKANTLVAGSPARLIQENVSWKRF